MKKLIPLLILCVNLFTVELLGGFDHNREITFTLGEQTLGNTRTFGLEIEDIDQDNDNDIFIPNYIGISRLWLNNNDGTFTQSSQNFNVEEVHDAGIANLNGDDYPDIFLLSHASASKIFFNNGDGSFTDSGQNIGSATDYPGKILLDDVDNDNDIDAFISYYQNPNRLWLNDGNGFFSITNTLFGTDGDPGSMELIDFNGDTLPDLFLCMCSAPDQVWLNDGNGNYSNTGQALGSFSGNDYADSKDIDGDGDNDIVVANTMEGIKIWLNQNNTGVFVEAGDYFGNVNSRCALFDADLDGDFDLIATNQVNGNLLMENDGNGNFNSLGVVFGYTPVICFECEDIDGDNDYDVVFGQGEGTGGNSIYFNESTVDVIESTLTSEIKMQNYPNPFNPSGAGRSPTTTISFSISNESAFMGFRRDRQNDQYELLELCIYNVKGQKIRKYSISNIQYSITNDQYSVNWNGTDQRNKPLPAGLYYGVIRSDDGILASRKMMLLK